jgi:hypothetical protein
VQSELKPLRGRSVKSISLNGRAVMVRHGPSPTRLSLLPPTDLSSGEMGSSGAVLPSGEEKAGTCF